MKTYFIKTYGCQMNEADSLWLERIFEKLGYAKAKSLEEADVLLINSCSVRQAAEDKVYGLAPKIAGRKRVPAEEKSQALGAPGLSSKTPPELSPLEPDSGESAGLCVVLTGCMVGSVTGSRRRLKLVEFKRRMPWVDYFVSPDEIFTVLPSILSSDETVCERVRNLLGKPGAVVLNGSEAYVPAMRGCDHFCSYCVVPYGRGKEISRPMGEIIREVKELAKQGVKKITLLGQNVNSYGKGFEGGKGDRGDEEDGEVEHPFARLLRKLHEVEGLEKIWFLTSNPWDFSDDLIDALTLPKVERYLHLPVQSGDDEVLKKMNRPYTASEYRDLVQKIRKGVPEIKLGTDLIVGFPGETEEQFQHTVDLVQEVGFDGAYIAMYSERPGTTAAKLYEDDVPRKEKRRRHSVLTKAVSESKPANVLPARLT